MKDGGGARARKHNKDLIRTNYDERDDVFTGHAHGRQGVHARLTFT